MNYTDIINQVVAEAIDREVNNRIAAKNGEMASLKGLLGDRDKEVAKLIDEINELKRNGCRDASNGYVESELAVLRKDVVERGRIIESLQIELKGVRDALKKHVDSEEKLRKELDDANARINDLADTVDKRDTRIEELEAEVDEKDRLVEKYKDMADAISDWANNDMPSLDPDDY